MFVWGRFGWSHVSNQCPQSRPWYLLFDEHILQKMHKGGGGVAHTMTLTFVNHRATKVLSVHVVDGVFHPSNMLICVLLERMSDSVASHHFVRERVVKKDCK